MNKIWLITRREYLTRVRRRSFLIMTVLGPLLFGVLMVVPIWLASRDVPQKTILVKDDSGIFRDKLQGNGTVKFEYIELPVESAKQLALETDKYGLLHIPEVKLENPDGFVLFARNNISIEVKAQLERQLEEELRSLKLERSGIDKAKLESLKTQVNIKTKITSSDKDEAEKAGYSEVASAIGYVGALLIYFLIFVYGIQTMKGVIEEKTNRIVEIIISSVKPFQLMIGKILGIGAVGLTQFLLWVLLTFGVYVTAASYFEVDKIQEMPATGMSSQRYDAEQVQMITDIFGTIETVPVGFLIGVFLFFFIGAYLFYGSLFAAIGAAVDSESDAQQFQLPVTIPLIFSIIILAAILRDPHSNLAIWLSIIPFTSPVIMMMRVPFMTEPGWDLIASMVVLVLSFIFTTWLAGKIYRIGILSYGSKVNYKTLFSWIIGKY